MNEYDQVNAQKNLSKLDIWAMAFGCMVGWGVFVMPGVTFLPLAGPAGTIISMAIGLAVMLVIATSLSYLMMRSPGTGGLGTDLLKIKTGFCKKTCGHNPFLLACPKPDLT